MIVNKLADMKRTIIIAIAIVISLGFVNAQTGETIDVPYGTSPTIDGVLSAGEWADASFVEIESIMAKVYFKCTTTHLYVAFSDFNQMYSNSSGIYIDQLNDKGTAPKADDIWIHGSAGPFEWYGNDVEWESSEPSDWSYVRNSANEYEILLSKIGVNDNSNPTLGILFSFWDWSVNDSEITWPSGGSANCTNPDSWANMNISFNPSSIDNHMPDQKISVFPNPAKTTVNLEFSNPNNEAYSILIRNINGQLIQKMDNINSENINIATKNFESGMYFIQLLNSSKIIGQAKILVD